MKTAPVAAKGRTVRRQSDAVAVVVGGAVLGAGMFAVRDGTVSGFEESAFRAVNDLPGALYPLLFPFQQVSAILVAPLVAVVAAFYRRFRLAGMLLLAALAKLGSERIVKAIVSRQRPATSIGPDVHRRGIVSIHGESFVSGHAVLVAAMAGLVAPYLRGRWRYVPWALVAFVMIGRVYVGAHNPLDVICGTALGLGIAGLLNLAFGVPESPSRPA